MDRIKVVVAKPGLDGHDRGAKVVARALRDAGMEVVYTGIFQSSHDIVSTALQEDADVVGISILSGAHVEYVREICRLLKEEGLDDVVVVVGGTIPKSDIPILKDEGVAAVFGPGTLTSEIVKVIKEHVGSNRGHGGT